MKLIKQCFPVVGFVFLKKVVQALEIAGEILKKIMKAVPAVLRLWVQSRKKENERSTFSPVLHVRISG